MTRVWSRAGFRCSHVSVSAPAIRFQTSRSRRLNQTVRSVQLWVPLTYGGSGPLLVSQSGECDFVGRLRAEAGPQGLMIRKEADRGVGAADEPECQRREPGWATDGDPGVAVRQGAASVL